MTLENVIMLRKDSRLVIPTSPNKALQGENNVCTDFIFFIIFGLNHRHMYGR